LRLGFGCVHLGADLHGVAQLGPAREGGLPDRELVRVRVRVSVRIRVRVRVRLRLRLRLRVRVHGLGPCLVLVHVAYDAVGVRDLRDLTQVHAVLPAG
jgi:hypothetical protein